MNWSTDVATNWTLSAGHCASTFPGMTSDALPHPGRIRAGLLALAFFPATQALWMLAAPRGFYDDFPGGGRAWVPPVSVFDEHLLRDIGAAQLGVAVVLLGAAILLERRVVQVALVAFLVSSLPHATYNLTTTGSYGTADNVLSLGGFAAQLVLAAWLLTQTRTRSTSWPASTPSRPARAAR